MIEITTKLDRDAAAHVDARLQLPFELRQKSRLRATLTSGEEVAILLVRGTILRGGDRLRANDGRVVEVIAAPEKVLHVECVDATALTRAAYHLGNRHVPVQVGANFLRLAEDHVLEDMLRGLGARVTHLEVPFEPEAGAYGGGHHHHGERQFVYSPKIHEYHK